MTIKFTPQQSEAIKLIRAWLEDKNGKQIFRLFGYAGTGKTTLAMYIAEMAQEIFQKNPATVFAAYTGKAALVLQQKGCYGASTIHSLIYNPRIEEGRVMGYDLNRFRSPLRSVEYSTIDEVSMVDEKMGRDLLSFRKKILVLGDPFQLKPISGEGFFTDAAPDFMLTDVRRQAKDNPIIFLATKVREGRKLKLGWYGDSRVMRSVKDDSFYLENDQILVGANKTRRAINTHMRQLMGFNDPLPMPKERLICLRNDKDTGLINGGMWRVRSIGPDETFQRPDYRDLVLRSLDFKDENGKSPSILTSIHVPSFLGAPDVHPDKLKGTGQFDFGNAITVHKAQGSQFDHVGLIDESYLFDDMSDRWSYTAITRAAESITISRT